MAQTTRILLTSQRNHIFTTIQNRGLSPTDFTITEIVAANGRRSVSLLHKPTQYHFEILFGGAFPFTTVFAPANEQLVGSRQCVDWSSVVYSLDLWISCIIKETELPDLWAGIEGDNQLLQDASEQPSDNLPFTPPELPQVLDYLKEIKAYIIKTKELTEAQRKIVDTRFDYMEEAAKRMGRKDWLNLFIGNLLGLAFSLALNGDSTRDLFGFATIATKRILGTVLYLTSPH